LDHGVHVQAISLSYIPDVAEKINNEIKTKELDIQEWVQDMQILHSGDARCS
jgi:hypothetical protein